MSVFLDVYRDDVQRLTVLKRMIEFVNDYPNNLKGLYLYGDFGVGKSFMVAALAHDLSENVVYHPLSSTILALSLMSKMLSVMAMLRP
ncbi:primosomal protein DnaI [Streptococcus pneumoniae SP14-BS69]|nr:primosomal protein DnaI [Streptococcus pneumoniae SP14-BS69]